MKIFVAHASNFNFKEKLYRPLRDSDLNTLHEIYLPQETGEERVTKDLIKSCDVVVAEVSLPSTGQGIELGWADAFQIPIVCIYEEGSNKSSSLSFITDKFIEYTDSTDMLSKLGVALKSLA